MSLTRRALLTAAAACLAGPGRAQTRGLRVATVDWAVLETLLTLGITPVAGTELLQFREVAVEPQVPASVADLGLRGSINFEMLRLARPDLIYSSSFYAASEPRMRSIARVESFPIYLRDTPPYAAAEAMTRRVGQDLGIADVAETYIRETEAEFASLRAKLPSRLPVLPMNLIDAKHFRVFGMDSMFGEALVKLGLPIAWPHTMSATAMAPIGLEALARVPDAWFALIPPTPPDAMRKLGRGALWNALPNVRAGRLLELQPINPYGGLPAARRFARLLTQALLASPAGAARG
jgi:ABC-type Fe3+-hydroxamate transport system substrate-binding protein